MIQFPGDNNNEKSTQFVGGYAVMGASERYGSIDGDKISCTNIEAKTVKAEWVYAGNINATQITAGTISADRIAANSITAAKLSVTTLASIVTSTGDLIVGGSSDGYGTISVRDSGGTEVAKINQNGIIVRNQKAINIEGNSGDYFQLWSDSNKDSRITLTDSNKLFITNSANNENLFTVSDQRVYSAKDHYFGQNIKMEEHNIDGANTVWAYNFSNRSDFRLKDKIKVCEISLDKITLLNPISFIYKNDKDRITHLGLIAQEVEKIIPQIVSTDSEGIKYINYNEIIPLLINSIKELKSKVDNINSK